MFLPFLLIGQEDAESLLKQGVKYHDDGEFTKAIEYYEKAAILEPNNSTIDYELALSYAGLQDYDKAILLSDKVIAKKDKNLNQAYMVKASALDMLGRAAESTALLEEAIAVTKGHPTLYYNLGINYWKAKKIHLAEENFVKAIDMSANHTASHYMMAVLNDFKKNRVQAILSAAYFLLLEPNTKMSLDAFNIIKKNLNSNNTKDVVDTDITNIVFDNDRDTTFASAELLLGRLETTIANDTLSEFEHISFQLKSLFTLMGEQNMERKDIWTAFYIPFYFEISKTKHFETFVRYITQKPLKESHDWFKRHEQELIGFGDWLSKN